MDLTHEDVHSAILIVAVICAVAYLAFYHQRRADVPAGFARWAVVTRYPNYREAAALLESLNSRLMSFFAQLRVKYHIGESGDTIYAEQSNNGTPDTHSATVSSTRWNYVDNLLRNYNYEAILENDPAVSSSTSLTIGKGKVLYLCLRRKDNPLVLIDEHTLFFVLLHEVSHIANYTSIGHGPQFWRVFKFVLEEAKSLGAHAPANYANNPVMFCGLHVDYSPYWDSNIEPI